MSEHTAGSIVFHYGDVGHHFYIVIKGEVEVRVPAPVELEEESATPEGLMSFIITYFQDINWKVTDMA